MKWYYSKSGTQLGPIEEAELRTKLSSGEVSATDLVWRDGMPDWVPVAKVAELAGPSANSGLPPADPQVIRTEGNSPYSPPSSVPETHGQEIPNYLWQSIVVTILCCWPFGIPAIVYAAKVDGLKSRGDIAGARAASASAKTWCMVAAGVSAGFLILWLLFVGFATVTSN